MSYQKSFVEIGNKHWSEFKKNLTESKTVNDTKKLFSQTIVQIINEIDPDVNAKYGEFDGDFSLTPTGFSVSSKIAENEIYKGLVLISDTPAIINRYAEAACHRVTHQSNASKEQNTKKIQH